jgi:hypothetical protein
MAVFFTTLIGLPMVRSLYAATFPWGMHYRLFMLWVIPQVLVASLGGTRATRALSQALRRRAWWTATRPGLAVRQLRRLGPLLVVVWLLLGTFAMTIFQMGPTSEVIGYVADDAAAMAWLRQHATPGEVLANDGFADAGIWAPYKAGVPILWPRSIVTGDRAARELVFNNVAQLDRVPEAAAAACSLHVGYVYSGAKTSTWDARQFPPLEELEASPALEEVFRSGEAVIFKLRTACG